MSVYMLSWSLMPLTTLPMTALADIIGAPTTVAAAGLIVAAFVGGVAVLYPGYRAIGSEPAPAAEQRQAGG